MIFFFISILAGILTILAPCILPLLPIVIGTTDTEEKKKISAKSVRIILALAVSVIVFTLLLKASTLLIEIPTGFWNWFSGLIIIILGLVLIFPSLWAKIPLVSKIKRIGDRNLAKGYQKKNHAGDYIVGFSLGPVFSSCSPTYLFIVATVLPASFGVGLIYLLGFTLGLVVSLTLVAYFGQSIINKVLKNRKKAELVKKIFGVLILIVGVSIITGYDKKFEAWILDSGYGATIDLEQNLIGTFTPQTSNRPQSVEKFSEDISHNVSIPDYLRNIFPYTNWNKADPDIEKTLSGGPGKDGIPSIDNPKFIPLAEFFGSDNILAIVLQQDNEVRVYPYNILLWHEIINDDFGDLNVAVTFCPLCGSALVFDRNLPGGKTTFGVSGSLIESNMVMYDRDTESLWQQSTGRAIAGDYLDTVLDHTPFQLLTIKEIRDLHHNAVILSENTGHRRDYRRNPYAGYEESDQFIFAPSVQDTTFDSKRIMVAFRLDEVPVALPMDHIKEGVERSVMAVSQELRITRRNGEIFITDADNQEIPFYFEMWFSWAIHNRDGGEVVVLD